MRWTEPPLARERRRCASRLLERALGLLCLCVLAGRLGSLPERRSAQGRSPPPLVVDLAHDPVERLALLPGIGPARARDLVACRRRLGPPRSLNELLDVPGWGPGCVEQVRTAREVRVVCAGRALPERAPSPPGPPPEAGR